MSSALGVRHGFDADHLTVIDGLARRNIQPRPILARSTGLLFSLGHSALFAAAALAAFGFRGQLQIPSWLEAAGALISIVFLLGLGAMNLAAAWAPSTDAPVRPFGLKAALFAKGGDDAGAILLIGGLFAISFDTLSIAAATSLAATPFGGVGPVILATASFCVGMVGAGGLNGLWISHLIASSGRRAVVNARVMTGVVGLLNLAVGGLALGALVSARVDGWSRRSELLLWGGVICCVAATFLVLQARARLSRSRRKVVAAADRPRGPAAAAG